VFTFLLRSSFHYFPTCNKTILFRANFCLCFLRSLQVSKHSRCRIFALTNADKRSDIVTSWMCNDVLLRDSDHTYLICANCKRQVHNLRLGVTGLYCYNAATFSFSLIISKWGKKNQKRRPKVSLLYKISLTTSFHSSVIINISKTVLQRLTKFCKKKKN
jgi:hypothetical protein